MEDALREVALDDEQLMMAFSRGDSEAFEELFARYRQPLFGFFRRRVADPAQAEELTQECFLAVIRGAARFQPNALFRTYLYSIGLKIFGGRRRKAIFRAAFLGFLPDHREPEAAGNPDAAILLRQTMQALDRVDREVLMLREFEQLGYAEIAEVLNIPLNTVRSRLFRARMAVRALIETPGMKAKQSEVRV
jgi:RNA polymerase sigma-70 factor (ECF subfamily)